MRALRRDWLERALVLLILVVTLVLPYVGGAPWAYVLILATVAATLLHTLPPRRFRPGAGDLLFWAAFLLMLIAYAITGRPGTNDVVYAFNFALLLFFAPMRALFARHAAPDNALTVARLALLGTVLATVVALVQVVILGWGRARGIGSNPLPSSTAALLLGFLSIMGYLLEVRRRRYLYLLGPTLGILVVFLSEARGALLGAVALLAFTLLTVPKNRWLGAAALAAISIFGLTVLLTFPERFDRIGNLPQLISEIAGGEVDSERSGDIRLRILEGSVQAFADSPWVGHGWGAKTAVVDAYLEDKVFGGSPKYHLHSDLLNFGVSAGVVGLLAYLLVLLAPVAAVRDSPRDMQYRARRFGVGVLCVGYAVCGTVNLLFGFEFMTTFYVLVAALLVGYCRDSAPGAEPAAGGARAPA